MSISIRVKMTKTERQMIRSSFRMHKKNNTMDSEACRSLIKCPESYDIYKQVLFLNNPAGNPGGKGV